jgi:hypothetical protein
MQEYTKISSGVLTVKKSVCGVRVPNNKKDSNCPFDQR